MAPSPPPSLGCCSLPPPLAPSFARTRTREPPNRAVPDRADEGRRRSGEVDPGAGFSSTPPMDIGLGGAGRAGSGGGRARARSGSGGGRGSSFALGGGGASAAAWTRLVSSGVEDELVTTLGGGGRAGSRAGGLPQGHFLEACFLCRKPLASNRDIFMYRGDMPFCTEECRREQIELDEMERKESNNPKKVVARAPSPNDVESSPPRPPKARAGSILAG